MARLSVVSSIRHGVLELAIDSGEIVVPGFQTNNGPVIGRDIYLTPFVARTRATTPAEPRQPSGPEQAPWTFVLEGDSVSIAAEIRYSQRLRLGRSLHKVRLEQGVESTDWFGFRISGEALTVEARLVDDGPPRISPRASGRQKRILVFVCSMRTINGILDSARSNRMVQAYSSAC